ncbi:hypothetical protein A2U01_0085770, partial [Trifolium medium]|nr:hypothetical protein [Trifolium medium]
MDKEDKEEPDGKMVKKELRQNGTEKEGSEDHVLGHKGGASQKQREMTWTRQWKRQES